MTNKTREFFPGLHTYEKYSNDYIEREFKRLLGESVETAVKLFVHVHCINAPKRKQSAYRTAYGWVVKYHKPNEYAQQRREFRKTFAAWCESIGLDGKALAKAYTKAIK